MSGGLSSDGPFAHLQVINLKAEAMTFRPMPILTVFLFAGLAVLIWLGVTGNGTGITRSWLRRQADQPE